MTKSGGGVVYGVGRESGAANVEEGSKDDLEFDDAGRLGLSAAGRSRISGYSRALSHDKDFPSPQSI